MILRLLSIITLLYPVAGYAAMTSTNYTIYADSIGWSGGSLSTSSAYSLQDTSGESPAGFATSTTYEVRGGYQAAERGLLSISLSANSLNLGSLSASQINTASTIVTVVSDSATGYTLSIGSASGAMPAAVTDGSVSDGSEEYGFAASGEDSAISGDVAVTAGRVIASSAVPVYSSQTTLTFKASQSSASTPGSYSQSITLQVAANF